MTWKTRLLAAALAAISGPAFGQTTLKVVPHADLSTLDPIQSTARITVNHGNMIYDTLYAWDEELNVRPQMVGESKRSSDGLSLTMTLRPGLKFHDGSPVRSALTRRMVILSTSSPAEIGARMDIQNAPDTNFSSAAQTASADSGTSSETSTFCILSSLVRDQYGAEIVHVGARRPGDEQVAERACFLEVRDVARVQQVKTAVGKDNLLIAAAWFLQNVGERLLGRDDMGLAVEHPEVEGQHAQQEQREELREDGSRSESHRTSRHRAPRCRLPRPPRSGRRG